METQVCGFQGWNMSNIFHFFSRPDRQKWDAVSVLMNILHKVSDSSSLFLYFCLTLRTLRYPPSFHLLCTADRAFFYHKVLKDLKLLLFLQMAVITLKILSAWDEPCKLLKVP